MVITQKATNSSECKDKISKFLKKLEIEHQDISLFILAFIHRSIVNERNDFTPEHNERLEYLWDAVLELIITHELFTNYPEKAEWDLTDMRSALVRWRNLAKVAKKIWLQNYLFLGKWEEKSGGRDNDYILANTMEAFIWALYLDSWYSEAQKFVAKHIYSTLPYILDHGLFKDFKTLFQEFTQAQMDITPHYSVIKEMGPDHNKNFIVWAYLWEKYIDKWEGSSKKKAQENAAENAYKKLQSK